MLLEPFTTNQNRRWILNQLTDLAPVMARRRMKKKTTRRRKMGVNVLDVAQSYVVASSATKAFFGMNLAPFLTEGWLTPKTSLSDNSWEISLAEMAKGIMGGNYGVMAGKTVGGQIKYNLQRNSGALATMIVAPVAFKLATNITAKPRRDANKLLKMAGLNQVVRV